MSTSRDEFKVLVERSKNLVATLRFENQEISSMQRAKLIFQLRLAYNLARRQCADQGLARELLGLIEECEDLLSC